MTRRVGRTVRVACDWPALREAECGSPRGAMQNVPGSEVAREGTELNDAFARDEAVCNFGTCLAILRQWDEAERRETKADDTGKDAPDV